MRTLEEHTETVTAISWLPDGSGFVAGALDRRIIIWVGTAFHDPYVSLPVLTYFYFKQHRTRMVRFKRHGAPRTCA